MTLKAESKPLSRHDRRLRIAIRALQHVAEMAARVLGRRSLGGLE